MYRKIPNKSSEDVDKQQRKNDNYILVFHFLLICTGIYIITSCINTYLTKRKAENICHPFYLYSLHSVSMDDKLIEVNCISKTGEIKTAYIEN